MLTPAVVHALVAAGATAAMLAAAFEADYNERHPSDSPPPVPHETPREIAEEMRSIAAAMHALDGDVQRDATLPATDATLHATVQRSSTARPQTSTERSRKHRAAKSMQRSEVSTALHSVAPPPSLSLTENINPLREREGKTQRCNVASAAVSLPDDFEPDAKTAAVLTERLGDVGAAVLTANFRDHYGPRPQDRRTPAEWQATLRKWARSERRARDGPAQLTLVRQIRGGGPPAVSASVYLRPDTPAYDAWRRHTGKTFPQDRGGGWWFASEWPPGMGPQRRESG